MANAPTFAAALKPVVKAATSASDLPAPLRMIDVTLDQISVWQGQPRLVRNARYDTLKESIRSMKGALERPIDLTEQPGVPGYVTRRGGGTRWQILNELWAETNDPRYFHHTFPLYEYPGVVAMRISHNVENLERGVQTYGDTARSITALCNDLNEELTDFAKLSLRDKAAIITERGLPIKNNRLMLYLYTAERLLEHLPKAFSAGMGRPRVEVIRAIDRKFEELVEKRALDRKQDWDTVFKETLTQVDSDDFDAEALARTLKIRLHRDFDIRIDEPASPVKRSGGAANGSKGADSATAHDHSAPTGSTENRQNTAAPTGSTENRQDIAAPTGSTENRQDTAAPTGSTENRQDTAAPTGSTENRQDTAAPTGSTENRQDIAAPTGSTGFLPAPGLSLSAIRSHASQLAVELAKDYGMVGGGLFHLSDPDIGLSYQVTSPDDVHLHENENWKDCLLVHSVMHSCMWASILLEVELGFFQRDVLDTIAESNPQNIGRANAWQSSRAVEVQVHRQYLTCKVQSGLANGAQVRLIEQIETLESLMSQFARALMQTRGGSAGDPA